MYARGQSALAGLDQLDEHGDDDLELAQSLLGVGLRGFTPPSSDLDLAAIPIAERRAIR